MIHKYHGIEYKHVDRDRFKYELTKEYGLFVCIRSICAARSSFVCLLPHGLLNIKEGYAWDGPSGPTIDTPDSMRASLVHDALYQMMREDVLSRRFRKLADKELYKICREDGMPWWRAWYWWKGVRIFGGKNAKPTLKTKG